MVMSRCGDVVLISSGLTQRCWNWSRYFRSLASTGSVLLIEVDGERREGASC